MPCFGRGIADVTSLSLRTSLRRWDLVRHNEATAAVAAPWSIYAARMIVYSEHTSPFADNACAHLPVSTMTTTIAPPNGDANHTAVDAYRYVCYTSNDPVHGLEVSLRRLFMLLFIHLKRPMDAPWNHLGS